jgi:hypothetical protein
LTVIIDQSQRDSSRATPTLAYAPHYIGLHNCHGALPTSNKLRCFEFSLNKQSTSLRKKMKCIAISESGSFKFGDVICDLPKEIGTVLGIYNQAPYFKSKQFSVYHEKSDDIAFIEWKVDKYIISPSLSSIAHAGATDVVFVNGLELSNPTELWPGSRIALSHSHHIFLVLPDPSFEEKLQVIIFFLDVFISWSCLTLMLICLKTRATKQTSS